MGSSNKGALLTTTFLVIVFPLMIFMLSVYAHTDSSETVWQYIGREYSWMIKPPFSWSFIALIVVGAVLVVIFELLHKCLSRKKDTF